MLVRSPILIPLQTSPKTLVKSPGHLEISNRWNVLRIEAARNCGYRLKSKQTSDALHIKVLQVLRFLIKPFTDRLGWTYYQNGCRFSQVKIEIINSMK